MSPRAILQRYGIDLALGYVLVAAVLVGRTELLYPIGPWSPTGSYGYAIVGDPAQRAPALRIVAAWLALLLPYFGPPLLLVLATRLPALSGPRPAPAWSFPRVLLACAAWIALAARFDPYLGALWLEMGWPTRMISPTLLGWILPFGPPLLALGVWAWRHWRGTAAMAAA
jgi:hypothetical protein